MNGLLRQTVMSLRLNFRNKMAVIYGYLFPTVFLCAFWVLYRNDRVPLALHLGELLTVTVLGGACLGFPTTMVSERERGVWRRYRLAPVPMSNLVASALLARFCLLITAGLLQLAVALAVGMPFPRHPAELCVAFAFVSFAFLGLGLEMTALANNVPAVQALGQCIFLPMLIIGGVAVRIDSLPLWAQHVSAFFPGRYAVEALQACVAGNGLAAIRFDLLALLLTGLSGGFAGTGMFRWDAKQEFALRGGKKWIGVALASWALIGFLAESRGHVVAADAHPGPRPGRSDYLRAVAQSATGRGIPPDASTPPAGGVTATPAGGKRPSPEPRSWQEVTPGDIEDVDFERLPPDSGVVTPIAKTDDQPDPAVVDELEQIRRGLPQWPPGEVADPVQRARNLLYVAAVPDILEMESLEAFVPSFVFNQLRKQIPRKDLIRILYWIGTNPMEGDDAAVRQLQSLGLQGASAATAEIRNRVAIYALKLLGRLTGHIVQE